MKKLDVLPEVEKHLSAVLDCALKNIHQGGMAIQNSIDVIRNWWATAVEHSVEPNDSPDIKEVK